MNTYHHTNKPEVTIKSEPKITEAGKLSFFLISVTENDKNIPLEVVHTMKMHLLLVNEELTWFDHIHPEEQTDGTYFVSETFPSAGKYLLFIDYKPIGGEATVETHTVEVQGKQLPGSPELQTKLVAAIDGYLVTLVNRNDLKTNRKQSLQFSVEKNGTRLQEKDMQPYLGATAHIVMINKADKDFLHIHPKSDYRFPIYAETYIEKAGLYRMWVQFKIDGEVRTADFTVVVSEGAKTEESLNNHSGHH
ncbi:hypothetical protein [Elizabethkingia anophelis]|uniref:Uncharacterized protein n=1 Tax=Elizabethkingia anophelis TaxID=1117645 RepID=X5KHL9_9FLAO|nr:hypothetical protein [Elizabethkingia anophelis]AQW91710.1 hypothetical protein BBD28_14110 [Elizabethkingia anophelis]AQW96524.1 hypothetical protein BBD31_00830 [Elizabethkingia anophelis]AQX52237.1 hypothetical protein AYC66_16820 [Elizabethkingia anophelis]AQX90439.1 hypothetical protein AYC67_16070 [Elizabethkingia anophelis]ASV79817.1 hypothetical protein A6J37_14995 [Elizabethkingia anophelis]